MKAFLILEVFQAVTLSMVAVAAAESSTSAIRRSPTSQLQIGDQHATSKSNSNRRLVLRESKCTLYKKCALFEPTEEFPLGYHEDTWVCELSQDDKQLVGVQFVDVVETEVLKSTMATAVSGETTLTMSEGVVEVDNSPSLYIPESAEIRLESFQGDNSIANAQDRLHRNLYGQKPSLTGTLKALVLRVTDMNQVGPSASTEDLVEDFFGTDNVSLRTQIEKCSYGKLKIEPFVGKTQTDTYISNGVIDIHVNDLDATKDSLDQAALTKAANDYGDLNDPRYDLIMVCLPKVHNGIAWAYANRKYTFYVNNYCRSSPAQMHEVGHNFGLGHSGEAGSSAFSAYSDIVGVMGASANGAVDRMMCYNPQKSYQLGWYKDKVKTINPLDTQGEREFKICGVADYEDDQDDSLVVLRLKQSTFGQDYYIGFNSDRGINKDTLEDNNLLTIVFKNSGGPDQYSQSTKVASLALGQRHVIENFDGDRDIQVVFSGLKDGKTALVEVIDNTDPISYAEDHCEPYTVEVTTDGHPEDTRWYINEEGGWGTVVAVSTPYYTRDKTHQTEVCLPMKATKTQKYQFHILDSFADGLCCGQGFGSYKVYDGSGEVLFSGAEFKNQVSHTIEVSRDPDPPPPTNSPTSAPTSTPILPPCKTYTIETKTDKYPTDTSWKVIGFDSFDFEVVLAEGSGYQEKEKLHKSQICLRPNENYEFRFFDGHSDGICCNAGKGYYRIVDRCGKAIVDSGDVNENFSEKIHALTIDTDCPDNPNDNRNPSTIDAPTNAPTRDVEEEEDRCKDVSSNKVNFPNIGRVRARANRTCKWFREKYKNKVLKKKYCLRKVLITSGPREGRKVRLNQVCRETCADLGRPNSNFCPKR